MFAFFDHTADAGFRVVAASRDELFRDAARALFSLIVENLEEVKLLERRQVEVDGTDDAYLLFDWLNELLYLQETAGLVCAEFDVTMTQEGLLAEIAGERIDRDRHRLLHEVKAITYHGLEVKQTDQGWEAAVIVDI